MQFISEDKERKVVVEIDDDSTLNDVFSAFENFLRAKGYVIEYNQAIDLFNMDE